MNNVIMIRVNGLMPLEIQEQYRKKLKDNIKEGLFIVDDTVKEVVTIQLTNLGIEEE